MNKKNINDFIFTNFKLRIADQTDSWIEYTDGIKTLFVSKEYFCYYFNSSESMVPITPDIIMLVEVIRTEILGATSKYNIFKGLNEFMPLKINDKIKEIIDEKH